MSKQEIELQEIHSSGLNNITNKIEEIIQKEKYAIFAKELDMLYKRMDKIIEVFSSDMEIQIDGPETEEFKMFTWI
jgi:hypothetical protein